MSKNLKIIIAIISIVAIFLAFFILPKVIPYTPPSPNIVKTDQGSFELMLTRYDGYNDKSILNSYESYIEYENYAKDYYNRISTLVKNQNLVIFANEYSNDGLIGTTFTIYTLGNNNTNLFNAIYIYNNVTRRYEFQTFRTYSKDGNPKSNTLEDLLQTPEYQNLKLN